FFVGGNYKGGAFTGVESAEMLADL
nr:triosephosphate isomerase, cytosolic - spinach [Spinacia oleracea]